MAQLAAVESLLMWNCLQVSHSIELRTRKKRTKRYDRVSGECITDPSRRKGTPVFFFFFIFPADQENADNHSEGQMYTVASQARLIRSGNSEWIAFLQFSTPTVIKDVVLKLFLFIKASQISRTKKLIARGVNKVSLPFLKSCSNGCRCLELSERKKKWAAIVENSDLLISAREIVMWKVEMR